MNVLGYLALAAAIGFPALAQAASSPAATPAPASVPAQKAVPSLASTEWHVDCGNNGTKLDCETVNHVLQPNGQTLLSITLRPLKDGKQAAAIIELPLGLPLTPVTVGVDQQPPVNVSYDTCLAEGCVATTVLSEKVLGAMLQGQALKVSFAVATDRAVKISLPLKGFPLAFDFMTHSQH